MVFDDIFLDDGSLMPGALDGENDLTPRLFLKSLQRAASAGRQSCQPKEKAVSLTVAAPTAASPPPKKATAEEVHAPRRVCAPQLRSDEADDSASTASEGSRSTAGDSSCGADPKGTKALRFPAKLVELLSEPTLADIIHWDPVQRAVVLVDQQRFVDNVVPKYFIAAQAKSLKSFHRQLNYYGFEVQRRVAGQAKTYVNRDLTITKLSDFHRLLRHRPKPNKRLRAPKPWAIEPPSTGLPAPLPNF